MGDLSLDTLLEISQSYATFVKKKYIGIAHKLLQKVSTLCLFSLSETAGKFVSFLNFFWCNHCKCWLDRLNKLDLNYNYFVFFSAIRKIVSHFETHFSIHMKDVDEVAFTDTFEIFSCQLRRLKSRWKDFRILLGRLRQGSELS